MNLLRFTLQNQFSQTDTLELAILGAENAAEWSECDELILEDSQTVNYVEVTYNFDQINSFLITLSDPKDSSEEIDSFEEIATTTNFVLG